MARVRSRPLLALLAAALAAHPAPARADGAPAGGDGAPDAALPRPLRLDPVLDGAVIGLAGAAALGLGVSSSRLTPATCRWCGLDALDEEAREALRWRDPSRAGTASDLLANAVLPLGAAAALVGSAWAAGAPEEGLRDLVPVTEAVLVATDLELVAKEVTGRPRPRGRDAGGGHGAQLQSFFSGHTTLAFSLAGSAGEVATLRGYPAAPWIWGVGLGLAAGVGWLRLAADAHWATDVLAGAAVGLGAGVGVPWILHRPRHGTAIAVVPAPGGLALTW